MSSTQWRMRDVVVGALLVFMLCGLLVGCVQRVHTTSVRTQCISRAKHIGNAMHFALEAHKKLPPTDSAYPEPGGSRKGTVLFHLLPFIEQENLYGQQVDSDKFNAAPSTRVALYLCPGDPTPEPKFPESNYSPNYHVFKNEPGGGRTFADLADGASHTLAFSERRGVCKNGGGSWSKRDWRFGAWVKDTDVFQSKIDPPGAGDNNRWHQIHPGCMVTLLCDGGVFCTSESTDPKVWKSIVLTDDGRPARFPE